MEIYGKWANSSAAWMTEMSVSPLVVVDVHFPKLAVVNLIGRSRCSIQSLAVEPFITFPIRLQIVPRWT